MLVSLLSFESSSDDDDDMRGILIDLKFAVGSGCIAALEAEKYLAELEDTPVTNGVEGDSEVTKPKTSEAPEYRSNPLL